MCWRNADIVFFTIVLLTALQNYLIYEMLCFALVHMYVIFFLCKAL